MKAIAETALVVRVDMGAKGVEAPAVVMVANVAEVPVDLVDLVGATAEADGPIVVPEAAIVDSDRVEATTETGQGAINPVTRGAASHSQPENFSTFGLKPETLEGQAKRSRDRSFDAFALR